MQHTQQPMNQLEQVELSIEAAAIAIKAMKSLERLMKNKDFRKVIDTGYLETEAVRLVHLKADFNMASDDNQAFVNRGIDSIGMLRAYFSQILTKGHGSAAAMEDHELTREQLLEEALEGAE